MARIRRLAALVGAVALSGAFVTGPARADSPEVYSGSAAGTALDLALLGKQATFGVSAARANSTGVATARGAGWLSTTVKPLDDIVGAYQSNRLADAATANPDVKGRECVAPNLPAPITLPAFVNLGLVCGSAEASNQDGAQNAKAEGSIAELAVNAETQVPQAVSDLAIGDKLAGVLQPVCDALKTVNSNVGCDAQTTVDDLVTSILETKTLDVKVGTSNSSVTTTASTVTAHGDAAGAVIKILPLPQVDGLASTEPVVTITVGSAKATATYDRSTGKATPEADPAIVRIKFNTVLTDSLQVPEIAIAPQTLVELGKTVNDALTGVNPALATTLITVCEDGAAVCILNGTPLASKIWFAGKSTKTNPDGSVSAKATAVRAELLTGLPELTGGIATGPGVVLGLAQAEAHVGGKPAEVTIQKQRDPGPQQVGELPRGEVPLELPRTGGFPILPVAGAGMLSLAVLLRRAVAKATR